MTQHIDTSTPHLSTAHAVPKATARRSRLARVLGRATLAAPAVGAAAGAWLLLRGRSSERALGAGVVGASVGLALTRWQLARLFTESAAYEVEARLAGLEVRRYAPSVRAHTVVVGANWDEALNEGFHRLADYIFGNNDAASQISMTAPVVGSLSAENGAQRAHGEKLSMTAPVIARVGQGMLATSRTIAFVMPGDRSIDSLPKPHDSRIQLREIPEQLVAVISFNGSYSGELPSQKRDELLARVRAAGLTPVGDVKFLGYDPPWTLPVLRHNEVMVEVRLDERS